LEALHLDKLGYRYPDKTQALDDINLKVDVGERMALIGPNGAGKSTLLNIMAGLYLPTVGSLKIMGELVTKKNMVTARTNVGLLFQDPDDQIFMPTVWDDVAFGPINMGLDQAIVEERVAEAMEMTGIKGYEQRVPHHLSFGEKKRVAIAGVLAMKPSILLLDEPTANLDPQGRKDLMEILDSLEATQVFATHDLSVAFELTEKAVVLMRNIIFQGTFRDLVERPDILKGANLELPPLSRVMAEWRRKGGKDFEIPLTTDEALQLLQRECSK